MKINGFELDPDALKNVTGGSEDGSGPWQLYYKGTALPMTATVAELCGTYPEIREKLGLFYYMFASARLNDLCATHGVDVIQNLINKNS